MSAMHEMALLSADAVRRNRHHVARLHSTVDYEAVTTGVFRRVTLVRPHSSDASVGRVSVLSPIGRALLGSARGDLAEVELPMGRKVTVRVLDVMDPATAELDE